MERVVGVGGDEDPVAVPATALTEAGVVEVDVSGRAVVVWALDGLNSALDAEQIPEGRPIGASWAFDPVLDGHRLTFTRVGEDGYIDTETGSVWNIFGLAVSGPLAGSQLDPADHTDTFWFAWAAFHPDTRTADVGT